MTTPDRSLQQRLDALEKANTVRTYRAELKKDIAAAREDADAVLVSSDPLLATMKVGDLLLAVPGLGRVKVNYLFRRLGISPSKTVGGLSPRQRGQLLVALRSHRGRSNLYRARREALGEWEVERAA
jgi:hypothetical protein